MAWCAHPSAPLAVATLADTAVIAAVCMTLMIRGLREIRSSLGPVLSGVLAVASIALAVVDPQGASIIGAIVALSMLAAASTPERELRWPAALAVQLESARVMLEQRGSDPGGAGDRGALAPGCPGKASTR